MGRRSSKTLGMDLISVVSEEQGQKAEAEAEANTQEDAQEDTELIPEHGSWTEHSDYAVLGISVAVAGALLGLITLLAKAKTRDPIPLPMPPMPPTTPTP